MKRMNFAVLFAILLLASAAPCIFAQATYTAASCNYNDVNACINSGSGTCSPGTHTAVNGDVIQLPACTGVTWTNSQNIKIPSGVGITITGSGTPNSATSTYAPSSSCTNTQITWTIGTNSMFSFSPTSSSSLVRVSCMEIDTTGTTSTSVYPIWIGGTCGASTCPQARLDNLTVPTGSTCHVSDSSFAGVDNMWGVADHNSIGDVQSGCNGWDFVNVTDSSWINPGSSTWGDNSWASADTFGTNEQFYVENNTFNYAFGTDVDYSHGGGGRFTCRFNVFNSVTEAGACTNHGSESTGRPRGGRQEEAYENSLTCTNTSQGCAAGFGNRSGVEYVWGNNFTAQSGAWFNFDAYVVDYRTFAGVGTQFGYWGECNGAGNYDTNDSTTFYTGTVTPTTGTIFTDTAQTWTSTFGSSNWAQIAAAAGTPYSVIDTTQGFGAQIQSVSGNNLLFTSGSGASTVGMWPVCNWASQSLCTFNGGDTYVIKRATVCLDQPTRSGGTLLSGNPATPTTANGQTLDPDYVWGNSNSGSLSGAPMGSQISSLIRNRDFFYENTNQAAQTNSTSPFDGTTTIGVGHGTLANRPATCTAGVAYFASDQGSWNQSGGSNPMSYSGQGELFICTATNTWTLAYTPYTYPHPLTGTGGTAPNPPTSLTAVVH